MTGQFNRKIIIFTLKIIKFNIKKNILKTYVWSIMLYGYEIWIIAKEIKERIEAFKMCKYKTMQNISWTEWITNKIVL